MARLKGGKVFIDISQYALGDEPTIQLSKEQVDAIKSKGVLSLLMKDESCDEIFCFNTSITAIVDYNDDGYALKFGKYNSSDGVEFLFELFLDTNELSISIN